MPSIYQNFTPPHFLILTAFGGITSALIVIRRRLPVKNARALDRALAAVAICTWTAYTICDAMPPRWNPAWSIPLHICDFAGLIAPIALWTGSRWSRTILHYWGLGLCTQALITPTLGGEPMDTAFWLFWAMHAAIVGPAVYDLLARGYRPHWWPDWLLIAFTTIGYLFLVLPIDLLFGLNYGYVGPSKPGQATFLDVLGPWPHRLWAIIMGVAVVYFMMTWPWSVGRWYLNRRRQRHSGNQERTFTIPCPTDL
jgi:hypothetical integral membrane protein (TIGR02206 family)